MRMSVVLKHACVAGFLLIALGAITTDAQADLLGFSIGPEITTPANLTLSAGIDNSGSSLLTVLGTGPWSLGAVDKNSGANHGHLVPAAGCSSTAAVVAPLRVVATTGIGSPSSVTSRGTISLAFSTSSVEVAIGSGPATVATTYRQVVGANEQLNAQCSYRMTVTYAVSAR